MPLNSDRPRSLFPYHCGTVIFVTVVNWLGIAGQVIAQKPYADTRTTEGWRWAQIKCSRRSSFHARFQRCNWRSIYYTSGHDRPGETGRPVRLRHITTKFSAARAAH